MTRTIPSLFSRLPHHSRGQLCHRTINSMSVSRATQAAREALATVDLSSYDPEQSRLMDERCILVDEDDNAIGAMDKKTCC